MKVYGRNVKWILKLRHFIYFCILFIFNLAPLHEGVLGSEGKAPRILDVVNRWSKWSASPLRKETLVPVG